MMKIDRQKFVNEDNGNRPSLLFMVWESKITGILLSIFLILLLWSVITILFPIFIPTPLETFNDIYTLAVRGQLFSYALVSIYRVLTVWAIGMVIGLTVGWIIAQSSLFRRIVDPYTNFFRFIPSIIWVTMFIIWYDYTEAMRFSLVAYATLVICIIHETAGMTNIQEEKIRAALNVGIKGLI